MTKELTIFQEIKDYQPLKTLFDKDESGYQKYVASIFNKLKATPDLLKCSTQSILDCIHNAKILGLEIDARQHCSLTPYGNICKLNIEYRGYLYKMAKYYKDFDYKVSLIFKEDEFEVWSEGDNDFYKHRIKNPLSGNSDVQGVYFFYTYSIGSTKVSKIEYANVAQIKKAMEAAKTKNIWETWFGEMAKKFIIKRACKAKSSSIPELAKLEEFDNQDYEFKDVTPQSKTANAHSVPAAIDDNFNPIKVAQKDAVQTDLNEFAQDDVDVIDQENIEIKADLIYDKITSGLKSMSNRKGIDTFWNTNATDIQWLYNNKQSYHAELASLRNKRLGEIDARKSD